MESWLPFHFGMITPHIPTMLKASQNYPTILTKKASLFISHNFIIHH